jgi:hypothetical protein
MFIASKICKNKSQYLSQKYYDINNKIRAYMYAENMFEDNPKLEYLKVDSKHFPDQNLHPYVPYGERIKQTRKNRQNVNKKNMIKNNMKKLFRDPNKLYLYKHIRNQLDDKFERERFEK